MERSHRTDDGEFYRPYLAQAQDVAAFLALSQRWVFDYNVLRPHSGKGMEGETPLAVLQQLGYTGDERIALMPSIILDEISTDLLLFWDDPPGNDLWGRPFVFFCQPQVVPENGPTGHYP